MRPYKAATLGALSLLQLTLPATSATPTPEAPTHGGTPIWKRTAQEVIAALGLIPNPEKGYFVETFRDNATVLPAATAAAAAAPRSASTAIYYLLEGSAGDSVWHRVDAVEVWHHYAGAPLALSLSRDDGLPARRPVLGPDVFRAQRPQVVVGAWEWQSARSLGEWTLVGTTVAPGFIDSGVELAPPGWVPNGA